MDCGAVQQHAGDAIDRSLPKDVENEFHAHLERCSPCRKEVAFEKLSKHMVRQNVKRIPTPRSLQAFILNSLQKEYQRNGTVSASWLSRVFSPRVVFPTAAGAFVAVIFFVMVSTRQGQSYRLTVHTAPNDIIHQSFDNLALLRSGQMQPAMVSTIPESVGSFFRRSSLQFGVHIPKLHDCRWYGGSASEYSGVKQAHVLYRMGDEWVYVYEVKADDTMNGAQLSMPPAARAALAQWGWYTDPDHPDCNVVLWKTNETVCVAVSTMKKTKLLTLLTSP